jgi:hypothetical protein
MSHFHAWSRRFAVRGIFWRKALDWAYGPVRLFRSKAIGSSVMSGVRPLPFLVKKFLCPPACSSFRSSPRLRFIRYSLCATDFENTRSSRTSRSVAQKPVGHAKRRLPRPCNAGPVCWNKRSRPIGTNGTLLRRFSKDVRTLATD